MPRRLRPDALGVLLVATGLVGLALPFLVFKANRVVPGVAHAIFSLPANGLAWGLYACLLLAAVAALYGEDARVRLAIALAALVMLGCTVAAGAQGLTPPGNRVVRIAPGAGCWLLLLAVAMLTTDAVTRLRPKPLARIAMLAAFLLAVSLALRSGAFEHLSVMREYAVNAERFMRELRTHLLLTLGSLAAAVPVALPLGTLCHRHARLRGAVLGVLNLVQTLPAIALFGILMAPLAALAAALPWLGAIGIRGIGAAPAVIALFLYSLLPMVANTVAGLARVSPAAIEAALGMGMTGGQVLARIELPLALPVILTGVRIVLVQNIGLATIAALIGAGGLGAFVFQGIGQTAIDLVLLGALPTMALAFSAAVLLDAAIESLERVPA
ncbi:MAG: ABC transporter permease [Steroidobacteraceae bacterium]